MIPQLNEKEIAIIRMLRQGKDSAQMAQELCLSTETIYWYRKQLLKKFEVKSVAAVVGIAIEQKLI
ncbi:MAG: helix-turn-helix transcriptional regulator [Bacteroidia bacterium]|nr:helix-turn-helix transcriptional regulator [Bacteroidia bacterium]